MRVRKAKTRLTMPSIRGAGTRRHRNHMVESVTSWVCWWRSLINHTPSGVTPTLEFSFITERKKEGNRVRSSAAISLRSLFDLALPGVKY